MAQPDLTNKKQPSRLNRNNNTKPHGNFWFWIILGILFLILAVDTNKYSIKNQKEISYSEFYNVLKNNPQSIKKVELTEGPENSIKGVLIDGSEFRLNIPQHDEDLVKTIRENVQNFNVVP